jgi:putative DNA primase/helicase
VDGGSGSADGLDAAGPEIADAVAALRREVLGGADREGTGTTGEERGRERAGRPVFAGFAMPRLLPPPVDPVGTARVLEGRWETRDGGAGLKHWRGEWWSWRGPCWAETSVDTMRSVLYPLLSGARCQGGKEGESEVPWNPTRPKVANVLEALAALVHVLPEVEQPSWLENGEGLDRVVSLESGLLSLTTREVYDHSPLYFNKYSLPFCYDVDAVCPRWDGFLDSVWPGDAESRDLLQEWFGYVVSGRTSLQKFMFIKGASRGGKGVISRLLTKLMGAGNVAGPTFETFASGFGLDSFIGRPLAVIGDARSSAKVDMQAVIGRVLSLTGEDALDVDRKYKTRWSGQLPTRLMILSNELPWFRDASGALANRMLMLVLTHSFAGREDHRLEPDLEGELPGIFNWALGGLDRLAANGGRFTVPGAAAEQARMFADAMSPIQAFVRDECRVGGAEQVPKDYLWQRWVAWCTENDHQPGGKTRFLSVLVDAVPSVVGSHRMPTIPDSPWSRAKAYLGITHVGADSDVS